MLELEEVHFAEVSEEDRVGHLLDHLLRARGFEFGLLLALGATRRDTDRWIVRECRLSAMLAMVEDTERTTALGGEDLHQHLDYLRHLDSLS